MNTTKDSAGHGGARPGAGAPEKHPLLKRQRIFATLPTWLLEKLDDLPESRGKELEKALCSLHGWKPPVIKKD